MNRATVPVSCQVPLAMATWQGYLLTLGHQ
jgi:hypothetical protein